MFWLNSRTELCDQFGGALGASDVSFDRVSPSVLYGSADRPTRTNLQQDVSLFIDFIQSVIGRSQLADILLTFGEGVTRSPRVTLRPAVVERVLRNTIRNSVQAGSRCNKERVSVRVHIDVTERDGRHFLELDIQDDAGGLMLTCLGRLTLVRGGGSFTTGGVT
jgi:hypothetical protein